MMFSDATLKWLTEYRTSVLILVVLDDVLGHAQHWELIDETSVLILVVLDDVLGLHHRSR